MTLGEKLKQLRNHKNLSQPELAERAGIEQSYLSKLENDKSMPSNDIFRRLLTALDTDLASFISQFEAHYIRSTLCQIEDIENYHHKEQSKQQENSRKLLINSSLLIALATTFFYTGVMSILFSERVYHYESPGIILEGEPIDLYEGGLRRITPRNVEYTPLENELRKRHNPHRLSISENRGHLFTVEVKGGRRTYESRGSDDTDRIENAILQILGVFMFSAGVMGFVFESRMLRYKK
jgi:transcriptional regulator with XRE-family HTH domain